MSVFCPPGPKIRVMISLLKTSTGEIMSEYDEYDELFDEVELRRRQAGKNFWGYMTALTFPLMVVTGIISAGLCLPFGLAAFLLSYSRYKRNDRYIHTVEKRQEAVLIAMQVERARQRKAKREGG